MEESLWANQAGDRRHDELHRLFEGTWAKPLSGVTAIGWKGPGTKNLNQERRTQNQELGHLSVKSSSADASTTKVQDSA